MSKLLKNTFKAVLNEMPPGPPRLTVTGKVEVPTLGWSGTLVRAVPQGINPEILLLDVKLKEPSGGSGDRVSEVDLTYQESPPQGKYSQVTARLDGDAVTVGVQRVS